MKVKTRKLKGSADNKKLVCYMLLEDEVTNLRKRRIRKTALKPERHKL